MLPVTNHGNQIHDGRHQSGDNDQQWLARWSKQKKIEGQGDMALTKNMHVTRNMHMTSKHVTRDSLISRRLYRQPQESLSKS